MDAIFETKSKAPSYKSGVQTQRSSKNLNGQNHLKRITKETLQKLNASKRSRQEGDVRSRQQETASGIQSLVIKKRALQHKTDIFGEDKDVRLIKESNMNTAQVHAFNRYITQLEEDAIKQKRFSVNEFQKNR